MRSKIAPLVICFGVVFLILASGNSHTASGKDADIFGQMSAPQTKEADINKDGIKEKIVLDAPTFGSGGSFCGLAIIQGKDTLFETDFSNMPDNQGCIIQDVSSLYPGKEIVIWRDWFRLVGGDKFTRSGQFYLYWYGYNQVAKKYELYSAIKTPKKYEHFSATLLYRCGVALSGEIGPVFQAVRLAKEILAGFCRTFSQTQQESQLTRFLKDAACKVKIEDGDIDFSIGDYTRRLIQTHLQSIKKAFVYFNDDSELFQNLSENGHYFYIYFCYPIGNEYQSHFGSEEGTRFGEVYLSVVIDAIRQKPRWLWFSFPTST